jgi:nuclear pore complex protein Nup98-Nup96
MSFGGGFGGFGQTNNNNAQPSGFGGFGATNNNTSTGFGATNTGGGFGQTNTTSSGLFGGGNNNTTEGHQVDESQLGTLRRGLGPRSWYAMEGGVN